MDELQEARHLGQELLEVSALLVSLEADRSRILVERLIDVANDALHSAHIAPELDRAAHCCLAPAPVRRRVLTDLIDALRNDEPGRRCTKARHLVVA